MLIYACEIYIYIYIEFHISLVYTIRVYLKMHMCNTTC